MDGTGLFILQVAVLALIVWLVSKAIFASYFRAKEVFLNRIAERMLEKEKGQNGKANRAP